MLLKKYLSFIVLIAAALLFYFIKQKQRGHREYVDNEKITVPAATPAADSSFDALPINRNTTSIIYSRHARCRMECRYIDESEVKEILAVGKLNENKIQHDKRGTTYPLEGITHDKQHVRIVFAPKANNAVEVVTCIDLDRDWPCDCR
jgi:hypothetical protein